jgi:flagellar basal-body rod modification protein FlgD
MTDAVSGTTGITGTKATTTVDRKDSGSQKDVFLKLLVAQMKYQDPSNPASSSELMAQNATFTQVEKLEEIATQNASLLALQRSSSAGALVGRTVTYTDESGAKQTGLVTSVRLGTDTTEASAMVGGVSVSMGRITDVSATATSTTPAASTPTVSAPGSSTPASSTAKFTATDSTTADAGSTGAGTTTESF